MITIMNTTIATTDGTFVVKTITLDEAKKLVTNNEYHSVIGHQSTADILTTLLEIPVKMNRELYLQQEGEKALVFKLKGRPEEGKVLTEDEINSIGYEFKTMEREYVEDETVCEGCTWDWEGSKESKACERCNSGSNYEK